MISFETVLKNRRSVRKFSAEMPDDDLIRGVISAAAMIPAPSNENPVRIVRICSYGMRSTLKNAVESGRAALLNKVEKTKKARKLKNLINVYHRFSDFMFDAPVLLSIFTRNQDAGFAHRLREEGGVESAFAAGPEKDLTAGCAVMAMLLAAETLGLGACVLTAPLVFAPDMGAVMGVNGMSLRCFMALGFKDENPQPVKKPDMADIYIEV